MTVLYFGIFGLSLLLSVVLTRMVRSVAIARGWLWPARDRHMHQTPVPRLGGVAIYLSFLISIAVAWIANRYFHEFISAPSFHKVLTILVPGTLIFLLGIYDDIRSVGREELG